MIKNRTLFTGDNLPIMRGMENESVDLIYLDPPFNSNRTYSAPIGSKAAGAAFRDVWTLDDTDNAWWGEIADEYPSLYKVIDATGEVGGKGDKAYLIYMAMRLLEIRRILKPTGSIYLHCDQTMSHALKMTMDAIFCSGKGRFLNEIVWCYTGPSNTKQYYPKKHDVLLFYVMSYGSHVFNGDAIRTSYTKLETGKTGGIFKSSATLREDGKIPEDWWEEKRDGMTPVGRLIKERTGYPTQKPLALLERIIKASSNKSDIVFDPFCGCATTLIAAEKLQRQWIGIDISRKAVDLVKERSRNELGLVGGFGKLGITIRTDIPKRKKDIKRSKNIKHTLYGEQEGKCRGCKLWFPFRNLTEDHIIPQNKGGADDDSNLQLLCGSCNSTKGDREQSYLDARLKELGIL